MFKAILYASVALLLLGVSFYYGTPRAIAQIAPGVTQSAAQTATITGAVTRSDGTSVNGASVHLDGANAHLMTTSDVHGTFSFTSVPYGTYTIDAVVTNLGTASRDGVVVKGDISVAIQYVAPVSGLKEIARVSTSSSGAQINVTPASIASVRPSDYAFQGNSSWQQLLNEIPGVTVGGNLFAGFSAAVSVPGAPLTPIVLSINGGLPYETSSTLDGMPLYNVSFANFAGAGDGTNLSFLPMPSFDTADVVRGPGANAPSIVDSIGGSFVLHAPGPVEKSLFEFSLSNDPYGGVVSNAKAMTRLGKLSATVIYGLNTSPGPLGTPSVIPAFFCAPFTGSFTINGQTVQSGGFAGFATDPAFGPNTAMGVVQNTLLVCCVPTASFWSQHSGALGLSYDVSRTLSAQIFYAGSSFIEHQVDGNDAVNFIPGPGYAGSIAPGPYHFLDARAGIQDVQSSSLLEEKITAHFGGGVLRLAALQDNSYSRQSFPFCMPDGQYTLFGTANVGPTFPGTTINFNGTPASVTFFQVSQDSKEWINNRDFLASYALQLGSNSSVGLSYVKSYYNNPRETTFVIPFFGLVTNVSRPDAVSETTSEIRLNATTELSNALTLDASWYIAKGVYHVANPVGFDILTGTSSNGWLDQTFTYAAPRLDAVWRTSPNNAIRLAAGGGFALPPVSDLIGSNGFPICTGGSCTVTLTNLALRPETSFGFDLGTDIRIHRDTAVSFDLYRTNLYGQLFQSTNLTGTFTGLPLFTTEFENLSHSRYEGITLDVLHDTSRGIYWHGAFGLTRAYVVDVPPGFYNGTTGFPPTFCTNCANTYVVPGINFNGKFESPVPYANGTAQIGYRWAPGKYIDIDPTYYGNGNPYFEPAFVALDMHAGYALTKTVSLSATLRNLTGIYGRNVQITGPTFPLAAPTVAGFPFPLNGIPYGPRSLIVTANFNI